MAGIIISEASERVNALYGKVQAPIVSFLEKRAEAIDQGSIANKIFKQVNSTHWAEGYSGMSAMDDFEPTVENGSYPNTGMEQTYEKVIQNYTFKNQFSISQELMEDAQLGKITARPAQFMTAYERTRERFFARLLGAAVQGQTKMKIKGTIFDASAADGKALFSHQHKGKVSGETISNAFTNAFSKDVLIEMMTRMQNMHGDNGETLSLVPDTIIIPNTPQIKNEVFTLIGSEQVPGSGNNDYNWMFGNWNVIVWPYLNDFIGAQSGAFILMDSNYCQMNDVAIAQNRVPLTIRSELAENDANVWKGRARFGGGFVDFRGMMAGGLASGTTLA